MSDGPSAGGTNAGRRSFLPTGHAGPQGVASPATPPPPGPSGGSPIVNTVDCPREHTTPPTGPPAPAAHGRQGPLARHRRSSDVRLTPPTPPWPPPARPPRFGAHPRL